MAWTFVVLDGGGVFAASSGELAEAFARFGDYSASSLRAWLVDRMDGSPLPVELSVLELLVVLADLDRELALAGEASPAAPSSRSGGASRDGVPLFEVVAEGSADSSGVVSWSWHESPVGDDLHVARSLVAGVVGDEQADTTTVTLVDGTVLVAKFGLVFVWDDESSEGRDRLTEW